MKWSSFGNCYLSNNVTIKHDLYRVIKWTSNNCPHHLHAWLWSEISCQRTTKPDRSELLLNKPWALTSSIAMGSHYAGEAPNISRADCTAQAGHDRADSRAEHGFLRRCNSHLHVSCAVTGEGGLEDGESNTERGRRRELNLQLKEVWVRFSFEKKLNFTGLSHWSSKFCLLT